MEHTAGIFHSSKEQIFGRLCENGNGTFFFKAQKNQRFRRMEPTSRKGPTSLKGVVWHGSEKDSKKWCVMERLVLEVEGEDSTEHKVKQEEWKSQLVSQLCVDLSRVSRSENVQNEQEEGGDRLKWERPCLSETCIRTKRKCRHQ